MRGLKHAPPRGASVAVAILLPLWLLLGATPGAGQTVRGAVAEQLSLDPVGGATVVLYRTTAGGDLEPVATTRTDAEGLFALEPPGPGTYRVQADMDGLSSPLSQELILDGVSGGTEVALLLPSALLQSALGCSAEAGEGTAAVVGTVRDAGTDVSLSGALVVASWKEAGVVRRLETEADARGRYRVCPPGQAGEVSFQTYLLGGWENHGAVEIRSPSVVIHDLEVSAPASQVASDEVIRDFFLQEAVRSQGDLRGLIRDRDTEAPLRFAEVALQGTARRAVTDDTGRFVFQDILPGTYTLEIRSLGYEAVSEPVEVPAGKDVLLDLRVASQAVEIDGLTVTARAPAEQAVRVTPFRRDIFFGEVMAEEEARGAMALETLRRLGPGIRVRETYGAGGRQVCIETNRRVGSLQSSGGCAGAQVIVDGIRIPDGGEFLLRTPVYQIESIEFVTPVQAQILFGLGGNTANGVVLVYTRGKGPYASPARNREGGR